MVVTEMPPGRALEAARGRACMSMGLLQLYHRGDIDSLDAIVEGQFTGVFLAKKILANDLPGLLNVLVCQTHRANLSVSQSVSQSFSQ